MAQTNQMKATIMLVHQEAESELGSLVSALLSQADYTCAQVPTFGKLREAFKGPAPEVILLGSRVLDGNGLEVLAAIKKTWPATEVIMFTGAPSKELLSKAIDLGAYYFQHLPFLPLGLLVLIGRALERKQLLELNRSLLGQLQSD
jgi:DNA-binding NtrC family response regulator